MRLPHFARNDGLGLSKVVTNEIATKFFSKIFRNNNTKNKKLVTNKIVSIS